MALARARRNESGFNYWPGFVDALSTLVLSIVFLLSVFLVVQFFLSQEVTGKDKALEQLSAKIAQLNDLLSLEKLGKLNLDDQLSQLRAGLASAEAERDRVKGLYDGLAGAGSDAQGRANELNKALEGLGSAVGSLTSAIPTAAKGEFTAPEKINVQDEIRRQDADEVEADRTVEEAIAAAQELVSPSLRGDKPPVAEQLALSTSPHPADGTPPRVGMDYPTAYEPQGQPNPQR